MTELEKQEVEKVRRKVPKWFGKPEQINTKILLAYLMLASKKEVITVDLLRTECREVSTEQFDKSYPQMKNISPKNNAKVFHQDGSLVTLWEPVTEFVLKEYKALSTEPERATIEPLEDCEASAEDVTEAWLKYNEYSNKLAKALKRTSNIVGEYAEYLTQQHYGGCFLRASSASADIRDSDGKLLQVKARKVKGNSLSGVGLGIIRSWSFDYLIAIFFDTSGQVRKVLEIPVDVAKEYGVKNTHQHGWVITTNKKFLDDARITDMTTYFSGFHNES